MFNVNNDRLKLREFIEANKDFLEGNNVYQDDNLNVLKMRFIQFITENKLEANEYFKKILLLIEREIIDFKLKNSIEKRIIQKSISFTGGYVGIASVLNTESMIIFEVSDIAMVNLNKTIEKKIRQNAIELDASYEKAKNHIVR